MLVLCWVCLVTFLCFIISFLDIIIVFKRINYPGFHKEFHNYSTKNWASCASLDRILVRVNENIEKISTAFSFYEFIALNLNFTACWGNLKL